MTGQSKKGTHRANKMLFFVSFDSVSLCFHVPCVVMCGRDGMGGGHLTNEIMCRNVFVKLAGWVTSDRCVCLPVRRTSVQKLQNGLLRSAL